MEAISQIWKGQAGLAKTYWGWGMLGGLLWGIPLSTVTPGSGIAVLVLLVFVAYFFVVNTGIWRAAGQYQGLAVWAGLAKVAAVIGFFSIAAVVVAVASAIGGSTWQPVQPPAAKPQPAADAEWWKKGSTEVR